MGFGMAFRKWDGYPLVNVYITMERSTIFHGKIHYFDWAIFNSYVAVYQRVFDGIVQWLLVGDLVDYLADLG